MKKRRKKKSDLRRHSGRPEEKPQGLHTINVVFISTPNQPVRITRIHFYIIPNLRSVVCTHLLPVLLRFLAMNHLQQQVSSLVPGANAIVPHWVRWEIIKRRKGGLVGRGDRLEQLHATPVFVAAHPEHRRVPNDGKRKNDIQNHKFVNLDVPKGISHVAR
jgi:hypothetical protein